jgi:hypothetical protein
MELDLGMLDIVKKLVKDVIRIELFPTHTELDLGMLDIAKKLVKDVIHRWRQKFENINFSRCQLFKQQTITFKFQGI